MKRPTSVILLTVIVTSCYSRVPDAELIGTYDVPDHLYNEHHLRLQRDGSFVETVKFDSGHTYSNTGSWRTTLVPKPKRSPFWPQQQVVHIHGAMTYTQLPLNEDGSNAASLQGDDDFEVLKEWGRTRLCQEGCEEIWQTADGKWAAVYLERID